MKGSATSGLDAQLRENVLEKERLEAEHAASMDTLHLEVRDFIAHLRNRVNALVSLSSCLVAIKRDLSGLTENLHPMLADETSHFYSVHRSLAAARKEFLTAQFEAERDVLHSDFAKIESLCKDWEDQTSEDEKLAVFTRACAALRKYGAASVAQLPVLKQFASHVCRFYNTRFSILSYVAEDLLLPSDRSSEVFALLQDVGYASALCGAELQVPGWRHGGVESFIGIRWVILNIVSKVFSPHQNLIYRVSEMGFLELLDITEAWLDFFRTHSYAGDVLSFLNVLFLCLAEEFLDELRAASFPRDESISFINVLCEFEVSFSALMSKFEIAENQISRLSLRVFSNLKSTMLFSLWKQEDTAWSISIVDGCDAAVFMSTIRDFIERYSFVSETAMLEMHQSVTLPFFSKYIRELITSLPMERQSKHISDERFRAAVSVVSSMFIISKSMSRLLMDLPSPVTEVFSEMQRSAFNTAADQYEKIVYLFVIDKAQALVHSRKTTHAITPRVDFGILRLDVEDARWADDLTVSVITDKIVEALGSRSGFSSSESEKEIVHLFCSLVQQDFGIETDVHSRLARLQHRSNA
eukprot:ANDGO_03087.mRNA.1 hypothetical protein